MARLGLKDRWQCAFANDINATKATIYRANFPGDHLRICDVADLTTADLPGQADMAWASFPCQDLSLAGRGAGLDGKKSGAFWPFWELIDQLEREERKPPVIVLENVCGLLTSGRGRDFSALCGALSESGFRFGAMVLDASLFVPQSRPRLFVVAVADDVTVPERIEAQQPQGFAHPRAVIEARDRLPAPERSRWIWWKMQAPVMRSAGLLEVIEPSPNGVQWEDLAKTRTLLAKMSPTNLAKIHVAQLSGRTRVGAVYQRTRLDQNGNKVQRVEIRFDDLAGCLRTPAGGSSRQRILFVHGNNVRTRLLSAREGARLMGLPDTYVLPSSYYEAYHLLGDGVVSPLITWLSERLLEPLAISARYCRRGTRVDGCGFSDPRQAFLHDCRGFCQALQALPCHTQPTAY
jgi:DNA (cytosine-5)-methyltransferase 1